jgi:CRP-like cAMP-binding protein
MCVMNHTSGPEDVRETVAWFAAAARPEVSPDVRPSHHEDRYADVRGGWADAEAAPFDETDVRRLPLFAELPAEAIELVVGSARELTVSPGETVVSRWHGTRHFYAIVDGAMDIRGEQDRPIRQLGQGEFFGELAALDWGAGFGYARTASVVATAPSRLLVLSPGALGEVMRRAPEVERQLRTAARERLQNI